MLWRLSFVLAGLVAVGLVTPVQVFAQSVSETGTSQAGIPSLPSDMPRGYLDPTGLPDSLALLPAPPVLDSPAFADDEAARDAAAKLRDTPRWSRAVSDADLHFPHAAETFSCAANLPISQERTPKLYALLAKAFVDVGLSTYRAKTHYQRVRPFVLHNGTSCTLGDEEALRKDGSYPSGHSAAGWGWALILTEVFPDRADAILQRGWAFGESRVICNVHWKSDVEAGRVIGGAAVARLHAVPAFEADLTAAKAEVATVRAEGAMAPAEACAGEAASLQPGP
ncbi:acid phosphatase [Rhizobium leguminosarum]|uniref:acid phosphatase n=1 Tax=Rhizobium leguminosarum TaxID=384 RepID=UPI001C943675|nr:phosphatase PAP2 family protein [Rhizobium leguminosarum]MBY5431005.1 phosphatase PAP2 family protein [Rhizobium leguminosarum]